MERTESELIASCQAGHLEDFDPLYVSYVEPIYKYLYRRTLSRELAEDLTSQTFLKALEGIRSFNASRGIFRAWLYRIARNVLIDHYRDPARHAVSLEAVWDLPGDELANERLERRLDAEKLHTALKVLKPLQRDVVLLRIWDDLSYREIAEITGKSEANCKMLFSRALSALRTDLSGLLLLLIFPSLL